MSQTDCIWNYDIDDLPNCCVWANKDGKLTECKAEGCSSQEPRNTNRITAIQVTKCVDCEPDYEETLP
jgi:hypothetical protein